MRGKDKKEDPNPTCMNFRKLQRYNLQFFALEEILFFEYLMVLARSFGYKKFYHSTAKISVETGLKRAKLERIIDKFSELRIIKVTLEGFPLVKHFTVDFVRIYALLPQIYRLSEISEQDVGFRQLLDDFYKPLAETNQEENIVERIDNSNTKKRE